MLCTNIVLGFTRGHSGLHAPLHSWLVSLSLNPWGEGMSMPNPCTSCGDSVWGTCVNSVCGLHAGYSLAILDVMGGELLHVAPLSIVLSPEAPYQVGSCGQWVLSESCQYIPCPWFSTKLSYVVFARHSNNTALLSIFVHLKNTFLEMNCVRALLS